MKLYTLTALVLSVAGAVTATAPLPLVEDTTGLEMANAETPKSLKLTADVTCPKGYPLYCPKENFCCHKRSPGCCRLSCCAHGATYCGKDGNCYR